MEILHEIDGEYYIERADTVNRPGRLEGVKLATKEETREWLVAHSIKPSDD